MARSGDRAKQRDDLWDYAARCLKIRTKAGSIEPFVLNGVQRRIHAQLEKQRAEAGRVRALILKARQPGVSTYVAGRFYRRVTRDSGVRAYILTHRAQATDNLFTIVKRFHDNYPKTEKQDTKHANSRELSFARLDSGYQVGTAKASGVGRSDTIQLFHGSEVAFWANAEEHAAGVLQAVPNQSDTEIILESTANGVGGLFYSMWLRASAGDSEYIPVFMPWQAHEEYRAPPPVSWVAPPAFVEYGSLHELTPDQLYWAWVKNGELAAAAGDPPEALCWRFRQEYPATPHEAFQVSGEGYIPAALVLAARQRSLADQDHAPLTIGVDVAGGGGGETWMIDRQGRAAGRRLNERYKTGDQMELAGILGRHIERLNPDMVFIDVGGGYGSGVFDRLKERGFGRWLTAVQFGGKPHNSRDYANKRAEIWGGLRDWLADPGGADIPDDDVLHSHICAPGYTLNSNDQTVLEPKAKIRERLQLSPDGGDALALTFADPVRRGQRRWQRVADHDYPILG